MQKNRAIIIANKASGRADTDLTAVRDILRDHGIDSYLCFFEQVTQIKSLVRRHQDKVDRIIIGGGDGTLNAAIEVVLESGLPLGILPLGTANDLARTLGIPFEAQAAAQVIGRGKLSRIDLGRVNRKHFFNAAHIGLAAQVTHQLSTEMKKRWGWLAYPMAFFHAYRSNRPFRARIRYDGQTLQIRSIQITIGNGRHYGGGMTVNQDAALDDHRFHFFSLKPQNMWQLLLSLPAMAKGTFRWGDKVLLADAEQISVLTRRTMPIDTDGELTTHTPAHFQIVKAALSVFVP